MGQTALDLPDPLQTGAVASAASADDLLAQLASEEIDRLLAEADESPAPPLNLPAGVATADGESAGSPAGVLPPPPISTPPTTELPDWLAAELPPPSSIPPDLPPAPPAVPPAAAAPIASAIFEAPPMPRKLSSAAAVAVELDEEVSLGTRVSSFAPTPIDAPAPIAAPVGPGVGEHPAPAAAPAAEPVAAPQAEEPSPSVERMAWTPARLPLILRPLEWLNAPLDFFPDTLREAIGKVAILTLVNAMAVLAYVLVFRRHH